MCVLAACAHPDPGGGASVTPPPASTSGAPILLEPAVLRMADDPRVMLTRQLRVVADRPVRATVTLDDGERVDTLAYEALTATQDLVVAGFRAARTYAVTLTLTDAQGATTTVDDLSVTTQEPPAHWPEWTVLATPAAMEPGHTLVSFRSEEPPDEYLVLVDEAGEWVWGFQPDGRVQDARMSADGHLLLLQEGVVVEMDLAGRLRRSLAGPGDAAPDAVVAGTVNGFHHEIKTLGPDRWLTLTIEHLDVVGYPADYDDPSQVQVAHVADDHVVVLDASGAVLERWRSSDHLDLHRIGYDSLTERVGDDADWVHANAVAVDPADEDFVVSLRHQDALVKFDRTDGHIRWILANDANWGPELDALRLRPVGEPFAWPYHQHGHNFAADGTLLVFDNGNARASPFTDEVPMTEAQSYSRVVGYAIDEVAGTVSQVWSYDETTSGVAYSSSMGEAQELPETGNVLMTFGSVEYLDGLSAVARDVGDFSVRLVEVERATGAEVFDLAIWSHRSDDTYGWRCNRAERVDTVGALAVRASETE